MPAVSCSLEAENPISTVGDQGVAHIADLSWLLFALAIFGCRELRRSPRPSSGTTLGAAQLQQNPTSNVQRTFRYRYYSADGIRRAICRGLQRPLLPKMGIVGHEAPLMA